MNVYIGRRQTQVHDDELWAIVQFVYSQGFQNGAKTCVETNVYRGEKLIDTFQNLYELRVSEALEVAQDYASRLDRSYNYK